MKRMTAFLKKIESERAEFDVRALLNWAFRSIWLIFAIGCFALSKNNSAIFSFRELFNHFLPMQRADILLGDVQLLTQIYFGLFGFSFFSFFGCRNRAVSCESDLKTPVSFIGRTVAEGNRFCAALCREESVVTASGAEISFQNQFLS